MNNIKKNIKVKASTPCYANGITLTPYVTDDGYIWLASEGNGNSVGFWKIKGR